MIALPRSTYYRRPPEERPAAADERFGADQALVDAITAIRRAHPAYGYGASRPRRAARGSA